MRLNQALRISSVKPEPISYIGSTSTEPNNGGYFEQSITSFSALADTQVGDLIIIINTGVDAGSTIPTFVTNSEWTTISNFGGQLSIPNSFPTSYKGYRSTISYKIATQSGSSQNFTGISATYAGGVCHVFRPTLPLSTTSYAYNSLSPPQNNNATLFFATNESPGYGGMGFVIESSGITTSPASFKSTLYGGKYLSENAYRSFSSNAYDRFYIQGY